LDHPSPFPVKLPEMCIKLHSIKPDMTTCDPFLGISTTAIACRNLGISRFIGYEMDKKYYGAVVCTLLAPTTTAMTNSPFYIIKPQFNSFDLLSYPITITKQICLRFSQYLDIDVIIAA
jgi:hypothetical protein